ncbi:SDR family NAD(P)-dependent oxidoreductase [Tianweitania sediminis]|uniref:SDR family oxidoreductase n=1 Tax=Tianweitania sediminis TaxID=1502156 RepID=A0A8J7R4M1_9HYPH|nr:SDR family oxidoreductase [Tianweitania sediminis]MBP0437352.1 SDR family oxidoreductase [Tianweitania sediminis]
MQLTNKLAVITGGASGQGLASARLFLREGARVVIVDWNAEKGEAAAAELSHLGSATFIVCDLGDASQVEAACSRILAEHGVPDILFNNAGIGYSETARYPMVSIFETTLEAWNDIIRINLTGAFLMTRFLGREMVDAKRGSIIFNASIAGIVGQKNIDAYTASKGGLVALTRALAASLGEHNIRVNAIAPGAIDTPMLAPALGNAGVVQRLEATPLGRLGTPEDIAGLALFLASDHSAFVTGQIIACDGGRVAI